MKHFFPVLCLGLLLTNCSSDNRKTDTPVSTADETDYSVVQDSGNVSQGLGTPPRDSLRLEAKVIRTKGGFGYEIYTNGKRFISQENIPSVQGKRSFSSEDKARRVAEFVIEKIRRNIMPPAVSERELDSLKVL